MMKFRLFHLSGDPVTGICDHSEVDAFCSHHRVVDYQSHFVHQPGAWGWSVLVAYREAGRSSARIPAPKKPRSRKATLELDGQEKERFERLRAWRNAKAIEEGRPPYALFTNAMLAGLARQAPASLSDLRKVEGVGEGLARKYGEALLALMPLPVDGEAAEGAGSDA
jgi:superfamily II DNA helicase RecQ